MVCLGGGMVSESLAWPRHGINATAQNVAPSLTHHIGIFVAGQVFTGSLCLLGSFGVVGGSSDGWGRGRIAALEGSNSGSGCRSKELRARRHSNR